jgi:arsenite methyltransferase
MIEEAINVRYSNLSESGCCLSCGGAINHVAAKEGQTCVDLGSGRGNDVIRMAELVGTSGFVYGIDLSEGMVLKAQSNLKKFDIQQARIIRSDLENLPLKDATADWVISNCTINHCSDKQQVWNEIFRILKVGGSFVVSDIYAVNPIPEIYQNDPTAVAECWAGAMTKSEYMQVLKQAGFDHVNILEESTPYEKGHAQVCSFTIKSSK